MSWKAVALTAAFLLPVRPTVDPAEEASGALACVKVRGEARPTGYGYRHVVVLTNGCQVAATCDVASNVNPQSVQVTLAPSERSEVVTFLESPVSAFEPQVSCRPKP